MFDRERSLYTELRRRAIPVDSFASQIGAMIQRLRSLHVEVVEATQRFEDASTDKKRLKARRSIKQSLDRIRKCQRELNQLLRHRNANVHASREGDFGREFDKLLAIPYVTGIRHAWTEEYGDELELLLTASEEVKGVVYDLGDWAIRFGPQRDIPFVYNVRNTYKTSSSGAHPNHFPNGGTYTFFCTGKRKADIMTFMMNGDFFGALTVYAHAINGINKRSHGSITTMFPRKKG